MKYRRKRMLIFSMVCLLGFTQAAGQPVWAASLDELEQQKQQTQQDAQDAKQDLEDAKDRTDSLQEEAEALEGEYRSLNSQLQSVAGQISDTEEAIATTSEDIDDLNAQLAEAQQKAREQYEAMKKRIQYMYENGNDSMLISILSSGSIAEFVKRAEYAYSIARYDQQMLEQYDQLQQDIAAKTAELQNKQTQLSSYQDTLSAKHQEMDTLVNNAGPTFPPKTRKSAPPRCPRRSSRLRSRSWRRTRNGWMSRLPTNSCAWLSRLPRRSRRVVRRRIPPGRWRAIPSRI